MSELQAEASQEQKAFIHQLDTLESTGKMTPALLVCLIALGMVIVEIIIAWILLANAKSDLSSASARITTAQTKLATPAMKASEATANTISTGLKQFTQLEAQDKDYQPLLDDLRKRVVVNTRLKTFSVDSQGLIKLDGEAKGYLDVSNLLASLKQSDVIKNISLVSLSFSDKLKSFSLTAQYIPPAAKSTQSQSQSGVNSSASVSATPVATQGGQ